MVKITYACAKCGGPARSSSMFYNPTTASESMACPGCNSMDIKMVREYSFKDGWTILYASGVEAKVREQGDAYLRLLKGPVEQARNAQTLADIPLTARIRLIETAEQTQRILEESGILKVLDKMGLGVESHATTISIDDA